MNKENPVLENLAEPDIKPGRNHKGRGQKRHDCGPNTVMDETKNNNSNNTRCTLAIG